jgi:ketosteroid isomerase-like protein
MILSLTVMASAHAAALEGSADTLVFEKIFSDWTDAFNQREAAKTCELFAKSAVASYQGVPEKNYDAICNNLKKILAKSDRKYQYSYKIQDVYRSQSLAAVRVTWYLQEYVQDKMVSLTVDQGLDVFQQNKDGQWQIVNYVAFPDKHA